MLQLTASCCLFSLYINKYDGHGVCRFYKKKTGKIVLKMNFFIISVSKLIEHFPECSTLFLSLLKARLNCSDFPNPSKLTPAVGRGFFIVACLFYSYYNLINTGRK